jgi:hypothetical protein
MCSQNGNGHTEQIRWSAGTGRNPAVAGDAAYSAARLRAGTMGRRGGEEHAWGAGKRVEWGRGS